MSVESTSWPEAPAIIDWNEFYFSVAFLSAMRSDAKVKIGACLVNEDERVIGVGFNGMAQAENGTKINHAAANAISLKTDDMRGCKLYLTKYPCNDCAKTILNSEIRELHFLENEDGKQDANDPVTKALFENATDFKLRPKPYIAKFEVFIDDKERKVFHCKS